ncbi:hypothetical protein [Acuticoccus sp.]|uniref:iron-sulfur cluster-binding protein n=1 Tax=Acuticoccus sp. TaxID=1904378 RepID=UPI003B51CBC1
MSLSFEPPQEFAGARAGQFLLAASQRQGAPLLGRPISILSAEPLSIAFARVGAGTEALAAGAVGEAVHVVGPLGRPFGPVTDGTLVVTDASHFGTLLALVMEHRGLLPVILIRSGPSPGSACAAQDARLRDLFAPHAAALDAVSIDELEPTLQRLAPPAYAAGGADPAMAVVQRVAAATGAPGQVAMQAVMGCGVGACHSCVHPMRAGGYALVCEGPVFALDAPTFAADRAVTA